jgi:hypothetical protein
VNRALHRGGRRESRVPVAPAASCAKCRKHTSSSPQVHRDTRPSLRNGFNGFLRALPGDRACLPPSLARITPRNLTPASGRQDHTTSPSALTPLVLRRCRVHRIPHPTFVTTAKRPSCGCGIAWVLKLFLPAGETNYFCAWDWTTQIRLNPLGKSRFTLPRIPGLRSRTRGAGNAPDCPRSTHPTGYFAAYLNVLLQKGWVH